MKLEEAIEILENTIKLVRITFPSGTISIETTALETVINYIKEESIPRAVVEEKIRELENQEPADDDYAFEIQNDIHSKINVLQEILNKGEK